MRMDWRPLRRRLGLLGVLLALLAILWPAVGQRALALGPTDFTINPTSGAPGGTITVTPNGNSGTYPANDQIDLVYDCNFPTENLTYHVQADGTLPTMTIAIPTDTSSCTAGAGSTTANIYVIIGAAEALLGPVPFTVTGLVPDTSTPVGGTPLPTVTGTPPTSTPVTGTPPTSTPPTSPQFTLNPTTAALGQPVSFSAGGFKPGEQVGLTTVISNTTINPTLTGGALTADANGYVTGTFSLPANQQTVISNGNGGNTGYGTLMRLTGFGSSYQQQATLIVPATLLNAGSGLIAPGGSFSVSGSGFGSGEPINLALVASGNISTSLGPVTARVDGTFVVSATAPLANGVYALKALGQSSGLGASQQVTIGQGIGISLSSVIVTPGQTITVKGFGFTSNATITINGMDSGPIPVTADVTGSFSIPLPAPKAPNADVITVKATDTNGLTASAYLTFENGQQASVSVTPNLGNPGQALTVTGANFAAGENVALQLAPNNSPSAPIASTKQTVAVDATRAFSATYVVPALTNGIYLLLASGQSSGRSAVAAFTLQGGLPAPTTNTPTPNTGIVPFPTPTNTPLGGRPMPTFTPVPAGSLQTTYFAEGYTGQAATNKRATFRETLYLFNTTAARQSAIVTYYVQRDPSGRTVPIVKTVLLNPLAAASYSVNADAGIDKLVSIGVQHNPGVAAQVVIARSGPNGAPLDAGASAGSAQAATIWNFAEGYAGEEFQEYLSMFNPGPAPATVKVRFLPASGAPPQPLSYKVPGRGRQSINVRAVYLGLVGTHGAKSVAIAVTSDQKVVVDRVLYWGSGSGSGKFGYEVAPGIPSGSTVLSFPALVLSGANEPYITVLNPGAGPASLQIIFRDAAGRTLATYTNTVAPLARLTVSVRALLRNASGAVSAVLTSAAPLVAEAPLYFGGSPNQGLHPGVTELGYAGAATAAAAGGIDAGGGILYVFNPGTAPLQVTRQIGGASGVLGQATFTVPPLGIGSAVLPPPGPGPHGLLLSAKGIFISALINGGTNAAWGGTLLAP